jgi:uncharacterized protein (TIGR02453 family)
MAPSARPERPSTRPSAKPALSRPNGRGARLGMNGSKTKAHFDTGLFDFFRDLAKHNEKAWFEAHRDRYEDHVRGPLLRFISDLAVPLSRVSRVFVADPRPVGGSMFRIYRDTRFAKDKTPYKTHAAAQFRHRDGSRDVHAPAFYLHLAPGEVFGGGGLWHPEPEVVAKIRERIVDRPRDWSAILKAGVEVEGDTLKRVPSGFDPAHPYAEHLKLKDFYAMLELSEREACSPGFLDRYVEACRHVAPLMAFSCKALGLAF